MDQPIGFQIVMHLVGRRVMTTEARALRAGARVLLEQGRRRGLLAFRIADTHLHALLCCSRAEAGRFAQAVGCALRWQLGQAARFERAHFEPVVRQYHLARTFFYVLRQEERHGTSFDRLHEGSSLLDTLGLRVVDGELPRRVWAALPRLRRGELIGLLGAAGRSLGEEEGAPDLGELAGAAAGAFAIGQLSGRAPEVTRARRAAVHLARQEGLSNGEIAALLGVTSRTVQLTAHGPCAAGDVAAVRGQALWREAVANQGGFAEGGPLLGEHGGALGVEAARAARW